MKRFFFSRPRQLSRANDVAALIPEMWSREGVALLVENMQIANTVNRDFEDEFARFGDTVNTRQPVNFTGKRKNYGGAVVASDAQSTNIPIVLNQHVYQSFLLDDSDMTLAMQDLIAYFLRPAAVSLARLVDQICLSQVYQFMANQAGTLSGLSTSNGNALLAAARGVANGNLMPDDGQRWLALGHAADSVMMQNAIFTQADQRGDVQGLVNGYLGTKQGWNCFMSQNVPALLAGSVGVGAINNGNVAAGSTVLTVDGFSASEVVPYDYISIGGYIYQVTATDNATATQLTISPGLKAATTNDAVITVYGTAAIDENSGYAANHSTAITVKSATQTLQVGQVLSIGASTTKYTIVQTNGSTSMLLDRPLEALCADDAVIHLGPAGGGINFGYHRNCMTLALRPLAAPRAGALSSVINWNGIPLRTVITYDGEYQKHRVTLDFLAGVKVLDDALGLVVLS